MLDIEASAHLLARTINVGVELGAADDAPWAIDIGPLQLDAVKQAGFTAVRLAIPWAAHADSAVPYPIDEAAFAKVDAIVAAAKTRKLAVVLDNHLYPELMAHPDAHRERFLAILQQIAVHYRDEPASVMLEPLAEPQAKLNSKWNEYLAAAIQTIRETNPTRPLIVGPAAYNNARKLSALRLPEDDRNLIVTVHHYWPLKFTMQGEKWFHLPWYLIPFLGNPKSWPGTTWEETPKERAELAKMFGTMAQWSTAHNRPLFVGEFGSSTHADMQSRMRWTAYVRELAEDRDFSWGYWSYGPSFALYNSEKQEWEHGLLQSLIPKR